MNKIYNLLVKMHKIDFAYTYDTNNYYTFIAKNEYKISDFFDYLPSCIIIKFIDLIDYLYKKILFFNRVIAKRDN